jgi:hypothetical protein
MKGRRRQRGLVNWRKDTVSTDAKAVERRLKQAMEKLSAPEPERPRHDGDHGDGEAEI